MRIQTRESREDQAHAGAHDAWEPALIGERFAGLWKCSRQGCEDVVAIAGTTVAEQCYDPDSRAPQGYIDYGIQYFLKPRYVSPAPALIQVPPNCPEPVRVELKMAFELYWCDYGAAAGKLRSALEALMDHLKVKRFGRSSSKAGTRVRIDLHNRLEMVRKRYPDVIDHLLAAKWIGNTGVHARTLSATDIFDAMDLVEEALGEMFGRKREKLGRISKAILRRKGPRPAAPGRRP